MTGGVKPSLAVGVALLALCGSARAQVPQATPNFGSSVVYREDPASALGRYLRMVTANPRDLEALTGAGRAALQVGDAQAAIGFYARAEAISPRNGRIKAGLGSALVLLNQEQAALRYFNDAIGLGVPEADIASDRGLAYDLRGSAKRAQRDYAIALRRGADDETTRRMALSLAIGGEKEAALALLDPLLRRQDTAAWRARAFVLAMAGDAAGASRAAEAVMSPTLAAGFVPFFRKLPSLRPGEKAAAVHFGNFPGEGRPMRIDDLFNQAEVAARVALENSPRSITDAGVIDPSQSALGSSAVGSSAGARAGAANAEGQLVAPTASRPPDVRIAAVVTPRANAAGVPTTRSATPPPASARIPAPVPTPAPTPAPSPSPSTASPLTASTSISAPAPTRAPPTATVSVVPPAPAPVAVPLARAPITTALPSSSAPLASPTSSSSMSASGPASPGFGTLPVPTPAPPAFETRLADISATVREVARAPLVGSVELPPSSIPADLPVDATAAAVPSPITIPAPSPVASPISSPGQRLSDISQVLAQNGVSTAPIVVPPASGPRIESTVPIAVPPASGPRVETAVPTASTPATASSPRPAPSLSTSVPTLMGAGPRIETPAANARPSIRPPASTPRVELARNAIVEPSLTVPAKPAATASAPESRIWVQVAGGADERAFPFDWRKLRAKAPELLGDRTAWTTPLKATNRLLVGPFESQKDAQGFVNKLGTRGITAFAWSSAEGQTIAKLAN